MHTSALIYFALTLTSNAFPLTKPNLNTTIQRRSSDYDIVNVGGIPNPPPPPPVVETVIETVTAPGTPPQTVTVTVSPTPTASPSSSAIWSLTTYTSSSVAIPTPTAVTEEESIPRGLDRLARAFGKSLDSHLRARDDNLPSGSKARGNETMGYSQLSARGVNGTEGVLPRGLFNATDVGLKARGLNGTVLKI
ncbi:hypothetical protein BDV12DRAFT_159986 [Aspergillus spectabilis]